VIAVEPVERIVEQLRKEAEKMKDSLERAAKYNVAAFERRVNSIIEGLREAAKTLDPAYLRILKEGGQAAAFSILNQPPTHEEIRVHVGPYYVQDMPRLAVPPGKHRVLLLVIPE